MRNLIHCDGRDLLPGRRLRAVALLWRRGDAESERALERFAAMPWPPGYRLCAVEMDDAAKTLRGWLRVEETTVVIVDDGMILAIDQRCDDESCRSLLAVAQRQTENIDNEL